MISTDTDTTSLRAEDADRLLTSAVTNIQRDYPVHWIHIIDSPETLRPQRDIHPVFAGSFDWHSCVHQTWLAVRLLRLRPRLPGAAAATEALDGLLTAAGGQAEADFFATEAGKHWERPYGWAWLLLLDAELRCWDDERASRWAAALRPLATVLRDRWLTWLSGARWPTRVGTHGNTAFAVGLVLDAARALGDTELAWSCENAARRWYAADTGYGGFEPDAADFVSPILVEVDLMRRVLDESAFAEWLATLLPDLDAERWAVLREPVAVDDPSDPYGAHLAGLALSRAWCWRSIAAALPAEHDYTDLAAKAAAAHAQAGRHYVFGYGYGAEHWLGTFAAYLEFGALS